MARRFGAGTLLALAAALVLVHIRRPTQHALDALIFLTSLAIVWLGVALP